MRTRSKALIDNMKEEKCLEEKREVSREEERRKLEGEKKPSGLLSDHCGSRPVALKVEVLKHFTIMILIWQHAPDTDLCSCFCSVLALFSSPSVVI